MKKIEPIGERILIRQKVEAETTSSTSGIILTAKQEEKRFPIGEILTIGTGEKVKIFEVGQEIFFDEWGGMKVDKDLSGEENLLILSFDKVIARLCQSNP
jgi:co-chaperonin GroES (HSP10)